MSEPPPPLGWPHAHPFALFLSHDVDQIHDREFFRILADVNHIRRMMFQGESGNKRQAFQRILRALFNPRPVGWDVRRVLEIESHFGFTSTFYILHDPYGSRHGPRYTLQCKGIHQIVENVKNAGGEIGVHGGYYRFNNADAYRESLDMIEKEFGVSCAGIRNHYLRFSFPDTWRAQEAAGFFYDATFGHADRLGPRDGRQFPFRPVDPESGRELNLTVLPLTVMDTTLFRYLNLDRHQALDAAWEAIQPVIDAGGLVSLLWHNNFFAEPEYEDWEWVYMQLLERLALLNPWCATGAEIAKWWAVGSGRP